MLAQRLLSAARRNASLVCVGLDPEPERFPADYRGMEPATAVREFCKSAIDATRDLVCAYKPNAAFFEQHGPEGVAALRDVIAHVGGAVPVILDAKRGDIGSTARAYARAAFEALGADAVTVSPYLGTDSIEPFLAYRERGVFVLCRTSNPGGRDFQELLSDGEPVYEHVARKAREWNVHGNVGVVAGATFPDQLGRVRSIVGDDAFVLIPGVGAQGANPMDAVTFGANSRGERAIVSASRSVLYAGDAGPSAQRRACGALREELESHRDRMGARTRAWSDGEA